MFTYTYKSVGVKVAIGSSPTQYEASSVTVSYGVNDIPVAKVNLAVGVLAGPGLVLSTTSSDNIGGRIPIKIWIILSSNSKLVFDGYVASVASVRSGGGIGEGGRTAITLTCEHWCSNLAASTAISDERTPSAVFDFERPIVFSDFTGLGTNALNSYQLATNIAIPLGVGDLYNVIFKVISGLATAGSAFGGTLTNSYALEILDKLDGRVTFNEDLIDNDVFKREIGEVVIAAFMTSFNGGTLWHSLLACAAQFRFSVIPTAEKLFMTPSIRAVKSSKIVTKLAGKDISAVTTRQRGRRSIRAVVMNATTTGPAGGTSAWLKDPIKIAYIGGNQGAVDTVECPAWLLPASNPETITDTWDLGQGVMCRGAAPAQPSVDVAQQVNSRNTNRQDVGDRWARSLYYDRYIGGDTVSLITPLGYDIMPGICIGVASPDIQISGITGSASDGELYGYVQSVTLMVDAQSGNASRMITLSHLRSEEEDANLSEAHPLFDKIPVAGTLVPGTLVVA